MKFKEGLLMRHIHVKGSNIPVTTIIKGSDYLQLSNPELAYENIDYYLSLGGTTIDTAPIYGLGESETIIGRYLQERGNRSQINILTKGGLHSNNGAQLHEKDIINDLNESLERLQTDYIDLYTLHRDDPQLEVGYILDYLNKQIDAGRIRAIGASNWTAQRLEEANQYANQHGLIGFSFSSPNFSLAKANEAFWQGVVTVSVEDEAWYHHNQLPLFSWSPLARGFFTGIYKPDVISDPHIARVYYSDENWQRYEVCKHLAEVKGVKPIEIALAYVVNQSFASLAIVGARTKEEIKSCIDASYLTLTTDEIDALNLKRVLI